MLLVYARVVGFAGGKCSFPLCSAWSHQPPRLGDDIDIIYRRCPHLLSRREEMPSIWAVLSCKLVLSSHTTILTLGDKGYRQCWARVKPAFPSRVDNRETHELAFSTNLMVSSQSLSPVLRKEKLKLAKSFSLFSLPLISYKSPGELNIAKSCLETAGR